MRRGFPPQTARASVGKVRQRHILAAMSSDPFNFGAPPHQPPPGGPPGGQGDPTGQGNPFAGSVSNNPLSAPSAGYPPSAPSPQSQPPAAHPFGGPFPDATQQLGAVQEFGQSRSPGAVFGAPSAEGDVVVATPPVALLFLAAGLAIAAGVVALFFAHPVVVGICWLVAGPLAIGLLALFVGKDTQARSSGLYAARDWVKPMHYVAISVCLLCILVPAVRLADWMGRL